MTYLIIFAVIIGVIVVAVEVLKGQKNNDESGPKKYQYKQKNFFMSRAEHECFDAIIKAVGNEYHIFSQVHLSSIVDNKVTGQNWKGAFKHISQKSVDFVLCDKAYISPKLAIELDDKTHERPDRVERDVEVERILKNAGLPLLRLENNGGFNPQAIAEQIKNLLEPQGKPE